MIEKEIIAIAENFWRDAGIYDEFPRSLETAVAWALPLVIVKLPILNFSELNNWLYKRDISSICQNESHRFRACLIAKCGKGIIFLDGGDVENERRFSLAHEISHFLFDYLFVRERVLKVFGKDGLAVLDGLRAPTPEERLQGILSGVIIGTFSHIMERSEQGNIERRDILEAEDRADRLALELLAPKSTVLSRLKAMDVNCQKPLAASVVKNILTMDFGLPSSVADSYSTMIVREKRTSRSFREWLNR